MIDAFIICKNTVDIGALSKDRDLKIIRTCVKGIHFDIYCMHLGKYNIGNEIPLSVPITKNIIFCVINVSLVYNIQPAKTIDMAKQHKFTHIIDIIHELIEILLNRIPIT